MTKRRRIVVGGDTTPSATAALRWAVGEAAHNPECSVLVVHAFDVVGLDIHEPFADPLAEGDHAFAGPGHRTVGDPVRPRRLDAVERGIAV